jgi:hypothetical protein
MILLIIIYFSLISLSPPLNFVFLMVVKTLKLPSAAGSGFLLKLEYKLAAGRGRPGQQQGRGLLGRLGRHLVEEEVHALPVVEAVGGLAGRQVGAAWGLGLGAALAEGALVVLAVEPRDEGGVIEPDKGQIKHDIEQIIGFNTALLK